MGVKVCGIRDRASVLAALSAAKQAQSDRLILGLLMGLTHSLDQAVSVQEASGLLRYIRELSRGMDVPVQVAFVTHLTDAQAFIAMTREIAASAGSGPEFFQIHDAMPLDEIAKLKAAFPEVKIIKTVHVPRKGEPRDLGGLVARAVELAQAPVIDGLLLDSMNAAKDQIGGTGLTHDWAAARVVVDAVHERTGKPVALAGGLSPRNMEEAVERTHADMVDANTGFRLRSPGQGRSGREAPAPKDESAIFSALERMKRRFSGYFQALQPAAKSGRS